MQAHAVVAHLMLYQNGFSPLYIGLNQLNGTSANARLTSSTATLIPRDIWFYYDIHCNDWLYLNGLKRSKNQEISLQFLNSTST